jgi:hypothetical protein
MDRGVAVLGIGGVALAAIALTAGKASAAPGQGGGGGGTSGGGCGTMDANIPAATAAAVCQAIAGANATNCEALITFSNTLASTYPLASALLYQKAMTFPACSGGGGGGGAPAVPCTPGTSVLSSVSAAVESDLAYALGVFLNQSGVLGNASVNPAQVNLNAFWAPPGAPTQGGGGGGGGGAAAPFTMESEFTYVTQAVAQGTGVTNWIVPPGGWPAYATQQAVDVNSSSAPAGNYYATDNSPGGEFYQFTKGPYGSTPAGSTTLAVAAGIPNPAGLPGGTAAWGNGTGGGGGGGTGGGAAPSTLQTLLGNMGNFAEAVDALQIFANLSGFSTPAGLPGAAPGVLDAQTVLTLVAWLTQQNLSTVLAGTDSGVLGSMQGALPGFVTAVQAAVQSCASGGGGGSAAAVAGRKTGPGPSIMVPIGQNQPGEVTVTQGYMVWLEVPADTPMVPGSYVDFPASSNPAALAGPFSPTDTGALYIAQGVDTDVLVDLVLQIPPEGNGGGGGGGGGGASSIPMPITFTINPVARGGGYGGQPGINPLRGGGQTLK